MIRWFWVWTWRALAKTVRFYSRGMDARSIAPIQVHGLDTVRVEELILNFCLEHKVDMIFVDDSGAGGAVVDHLMRHNLPVEGLAFGGRSIGNASRVNYANKRAEMWGAVKDRLPYLALPNMVDLRNQLISPEFKFNLKGEIQLEKKEDMRKRGLASPDIADALALTFARPVFPRAYDDFAGRGDHLVVSDYNPWSREAMKGLPLPEAAGRYSAESWARLKPEYE
jgi:hypothetical protein